MLKKEEKREAQELYIISNPKYKTTPTEGDNPSTPCLANAPAIELANLISSQKETSMLANSFLISLK